MMLRVGRNQLTFRNASLKEVLTTLQRHFDIEIAVKNEKIASFTYNFVCKGNDLNYVLEVMQSITPVSFKKYRNIHIPLNKST